MLAKVAVTFVALGNLRVLFMRFEARPDTPAIGLFHGEDVWLALLVSLALGIVVGRFQVGQLRADRGAHPLSSALLVDGLLLGSALWSGARTTLAYALANGYSVYSVAQTMLAFALLCTLVSAGWVVGAFAFEARRAHRLTSAST